MYECYLDGEYCENRFYIGLEQRSLPMSPAFFAVCSPSPGRSL